MGEVRLAAPVKATHVPDKHDFRDGLRGKTPGSFRVDSPDDDGDQAFWYCCPCGCGVVGPLNVGKGFKPEMGPSWNWDGSLEAPTLYPSVHHVGHWHGWLRNGKWEQA